MARGQAVRTGLCMKKLGMSRVFSEDGAHVSVTVLKLESCRVLCGKSRTRHGYDAVQLGFGHAREKRLSRALRGHLSSCGAPSPVALIREFRVSPDAVLEAGAAISVKHFVVGQHVDVSALSKGRGFSGVIKRHNFSGLSASHGVSISHRSQGSIGQCQDPGRVFKGKKMAGHYGHERVTVQNLRVVGHDEERSLVLIEGAIPGARGGYVEVRDALKKLRPDHAPFPAATGAAEASSAAGGEEAPSADAGGAQSAAEESAPAAPSPQPSPQP